MAKVFK